MNVSVLNEQDYYRIVYGGWLGKNIGGTLGYAAEGKKELLSLTYYPELPDGPLENDDLDLQLVWLHALEQYGPGLTARELGQEWLEHVFFPYDEYGYALTNLRRGLLPPVAGAFNNPFTDCMGSPIRSEIWAMAAPGMPEQAAYYAYQDAIVDHAGGEGVYGEMFFAAIQSAIFYERDRDRLIAIGLQYIPAESRTALALADLLRWHSEGRSWTEARTLILEQHGRDNFTDAPQNIAFTILGWLYGENFEDAILKAVNCGYDTDCTAATLGAILGMLLGPEGLPERWVKPVGDRVVVSPPIKGFPAPASLDELTRRTIRAGKQVLAYADAGIVVHPELPTSWSAERRESGPSDDFRRLWTHGTTAVRYLLPAGTRREPDLELVIDYGEDGGSPAIAPGQSKRLAVSLINRSRTALTGALSLAVPKGWSGPNAVRVQLAPGQALHWGAAVTASAAMAAYEELSLRWERQHDGAVWATQTVPFTLIRAAGWTVWGPDSPEAGVQAAFPGNRLAWEQVLDTTADGVYRARTRLHNPVERQVRLIAVAHGPVKLKLDGKTVIDCAHTPEFMPAYHRAPEEQLVELTLPAGGSELEIEAVKTAGGKLEVYVLPVSLAAVKEPGSYYYLTDMTFRL
ncbi:ADP-ribosylglycohydrolase [Paenibacillus sp. UNCCL117]|uniref:ADP-ribosylglycohydrolase family protein n=1 Tax=unclassified Paenibacillus TaxID=185978 RepID=UPI00088C510B|nr:MULTISPECIES: ADP-ribosylglycohydrolase family protein [unclassified Paenibacillus]SDE19039.1 ADP-ribosylglycohydrolase [Paenibacillus sp. cl123]SFW62094.1 ADP-ribosylglycohydrolase [Paenibacillus sp. UNCCL117]